jgi:hypothetical protein
MLERLEERETPAVVGASTMSAGSSSSLIVAGSTSLSLLSIVQQVRTDVTTMTSLNTTLNTDITTLKNDINGGATAQTIAGDFGRAASDFAQISTLNNTVQSLSRSGQLSGLLSLLAGMRVGQAASQAATKAHNNNSDNDDNNNNGKSNKSGSMMTSVTQVNLGLGLLSFFSLSQEAKQASSTFSQANTTASQTLPGGFPTVASTVTVPSSTTTSSTSGLGLFGL